MTIALADIPGLLLIVFVMGVACGIGLSLKTK